MKNLSKNQKLLLISLIVVIVLSLIKIGYRKEGEYYFFGIPAQWLGYYGQGQFSFEILGLLFNVVFFYLILKLINKLILFLKRKDQ